MKLHCLPLVTASVSYLRFNMKFSGIGHLLGFVLQSDPKPEFARVHQYIGTSETII